MQAAHIGELEANLTAKDSIVSQTLQATKITEEENARLKSALSDVQATSKTTQADRDKVVKGAHESTQQVLKIKEEEIQHLLKNEAKLKTSIVNAKAKFRNFIYLIGVSSFPLYCTTFV